MGRKTQDFFPNRMTARTAARHSAPDDTHRSKQTPPPLTALAPAPAATSRERLLKRRPRSRRPLVRIAQEKYHRPWRDQHLAAEPFGCERAQSQHRARARIQHFFLKRFVIVKIPMRRRVGLHVTDIAIRLPEPPAEVNSMLLSQSAIERRTVSAPMLSPCEEFRSRDLSNALDRASL